MGVRDPVWVVSPHLLVAQAVAAALRSAGTPAESHAWESAVRAREADSGDPGRPRHVVAILDGLDNLDLVDEVRCLVAGHRVRVAIVTTEDAAVWWGGLLDDDAVDVVTMTTSVSQLAAVVTCLTAGESAMDAEGRRALQASWSDAIERRRQLVSLIDTLSPQQRRVLELLASGRRVPEVGAVMGVTRGTVRSHVKALRAKLGARTQLEAVAMLHQALAEKHGADARGGVASIGCPS